MLQWNGDGRLVVDGVDFVLAPSPRTVRAARETADQTASLVLFKPRWMVEQYLALRSARPSNVVELGIFDGGSTALLALMFEPARLVAFDLSDRRAPALDAFIEQHQLSARVHPYFGVDQGDRASVERIIADEFGSAPLDLVVDDASHLREETTASFNALFPRLRPGGLFVIEDWSWQHLRADSIARALTENAEAAAELARRLSSGDVPALETNPLSRLVLEIVLTAAYAEGIVAEVTSLRKGWLVVRRGNAVLDPDEFDIRVSYGPLGRTLIAE